MIAIEISGGQIQAVDSVVNPDKLAHLGPVSDPSHADRSIRILLDDLVGER